jgi:hypothetical protein
LRLNVGPQLPLRRRPNPPRLKKNPLPPKNPPPKNLLQKPLRLAVLNGAERCGWPLKCQP